MVIRAQLRQEGLGSYLHPSGISAAGWRRETWSWECRCRKTYLRALDLALGVAVRIQYARREKAR